LEKNNSEVRKIKEIERQKQQQSKEARQRKLEMMQAQQDAEAARREFERAKKVESSKDFYTREQLRRSSGAVAE
jgi:hypothetical protein